MPESKVLVKHAFSNALIPVITLAGINFVLMINIAVVIESIFAWPGIGLLLYDGITGRDFPVVQTVVLMAGVIILPFLGSTGLWDPWETHYAEVARRMLQDGDWLTPRWRNELFFSKPVGIFWMLATSFSIFGTNALAARLPATNWMHWVAIGLGGAGLAAVMFAMILGHWYLNVAELPLIHLRRGIGLALGTLGVHLIWVLAILSTATTVLSHRVRPAYLLLVSMDGFFLWVGLILGLIAPLVIDGLALWTARLRATQSATGLLYVSLILVVIGVLIFDSYVLQLGLPV